MSASGKGSRTVICPGCGWYGRIQDMKRWEGIAEYGACPTCGYECDGTPPRLPTLQECVTGNLVDVEFNDVKLKAFLNTLFMLMKKYGYMAEERQGDAKTTHRN